MIIYLFIFEKDTLQICSVRISTSLDLLKYAHIYQNYFSVISYIQKVQQSKTMGTFCVQKSNTQFLDYKPKYNTLSPDTINKFSEKPKQNKMVALLNEYMKHYGRQADKQTQQFINNNYLNHYSSNRTMLDGTKAYTYKYQMIDRLKQAVENRFYTSRLNIKQVNDEGRFLKYDWEVVIPSKSGGQSTRIYYDCKLNFSYEYKFQRLCLEQYDPLKEYHDEQRRKKQFYQFQEEQRTKYQQSQPSSNNNAYGKPTDWNAHYNAQLQRSNQQFRENMNKQAREWNDYARQKTNRNW